MLSYCHQMTTWYFQGTVLIWMVSTGLCCWQDGQIEAQKTGQPCEVRTYAIEPMHILHPGHSHNSVHVSIMSLSRWLMTEAG